MSEKVLVTGSTGFIGKRVVDRLRREGVAVRVLLRPESGVAEPVAGIETVRAGYGDAAGLEHAVAGVDRIIHLAGVTRAPDEAGFLAGNVQPVESLLRAVRSVNPSLRRFLLVSSQAAAGPAASPERGVRESDPPRPVSVYGRSKLLGEEAAVRHAGPVPVTIVRPSAVYGPGDRDILEVFRMLQKGVLVSAGSGRRQRFSMIHVDDLVDGMLVAMRAEAAGGQTYFLASPRPFAWDDVIEAARPALGFGRLLRIDIPVPLVFGLGTLLGAVARMTGRPTLINRDKASELTQPYWVCSVAKAAGDLGFSASIPLGEGIPSTLGWYRQQGWLA